MFALRRIAARAVAQPLRQVSAIPTTTRVTLLQPKPVFQRLFHQSLNRYVDASAENALSSAQESQNKDGSDVGVRAEVSADVDGDQSRSSAPQGSSGPRRILYIGNLFFDVTAAQLEAEFARYGTVTNARVVSDARGVSRGFGFVEFAETAEAERALEEANQRVFQGRPMAVQFHIQRERNSDRPAGGMFQRLPPRQANPASKTLFIGNLSFQMSDKDLNDLFREVRNVLDVRVAIDRRSGQPRGFAHADFVDVDSAVRAKEALEAKIVFGRPLRVDFSRDSGSRPRSDESSEGSAY